MYVEDIQKLISRYDKCLNRDSDRINKKLNMCMYVCILYIYIYTHTKVTNKYNFFKIHSRIVVISKELLCYGQPFYIQI